jgi:Nucleotide modification associated domain 2
MPPRLYVYKLTHDHGAAPCVDDRVLTLAICKPRIRTRARVGDVIFGFAANSLSRDNRLVYIARVTGAEEDGDYYESGAYEHRGDRIYIRGEDGQFRLRSDARYHVDGDHIPRDLGSFPDYERARVLISDDFRYFGSDPGSPTPDLSSYPRVRGLLQTLGQGHRVNHSPELAGELQLLVDSAWSDDPPEVIASPGSSGTCTASPTRRRSRGNRSCG